MEKCSIFLSCFDSHTHTDTRQRTDCVVSSMSQMMHCVSTMTSVDGFDERTIFVVDIIVVVVETEDIWYSST